MAIDEKDLAKQLSELDWGSVPQGVTGGVPKVSGQVQPSAVARRSQPQTPTPPLVLADPVGGLAKTPITLGDLDVGVPGVGPRKTRIVRAGKRSHHKVAAPKVAVAAVPQVVQPAAAPDSASVPAEPQVVFGSAQRSRRPRDQEMDVLAKYSESPAVMALFESMWREAGHRMALEIGRPKASKQDAAIGWYMFLEAMRQRDAR